MWDKLLAWSKNSATHLWANIVILASLLIEVAIQNADVIAVQVANLLSDPEVKAQILANVPAKWVPMLTIGIMLIIKAARNRTLGK